MSLSNEQRDVGPPDLTDKYNTKLTPDEEQQFQQWATQNPGFANTFDYDARGFWKSGAERAGNGHGSDMWKKPNHPTFSKHSIYHGVDGNDGGSWEGSDGNIVFTPGQTNLKHWQESDLNDYFRRVEPSATLNYPSKDYMQVFRTPGTLY